MACRIITACFGVISKCRQWTDPQTCDPMKVRGMLTGFIINVTFAEIIAYKILRHDVERGELAGHVPDFVIISVSCLEALAAPLVSWYGARRRRLTLALWMVAPMICVSCWFALPDANVKGESEFCDVANQNNDTSFTSMTWESTIRLVVVVLTACVFALARAAAWAHCISLCDEYAPESITVHYGVIISLRAIALLLGHKIFMSVVETNLSMQLILLVVLFVPAPLQVPFVVPRVTPDELHLEPLVENRRGFQASVCRVCSNALAMSQMIALALLAAALWGYGNYENDIIRTKFLLNQVTPESSNFVNMVQYFFVLNVIKLVASRFSAPVLKEYCRRKAMRHIVVMCALAAALFAGLSLPSCDPGAVAGLGAENYEHPGCSFQCGCQPRWRELSPVCAAGDMVTYLSPCHAGCAASESVNGINVYVNCTCAGDARALSGGCAESGCRYALDLHHSMFLVLVTVSILAFQAQGVLVLKSVERRDRSVALGLTMAVVAAIAFVAGPLLYHGIDVSSCRWFEGDKCHFFNEKFPKTVGLTSAFIALLATLLCIATFIWVRMAQRSEENKRNNEPSEDIELS